VEGHPPRDRQQLTDPFASDVEQIRLSQASALEQAAALAERCKTPSQDHVATVLQAMQEAINQLTARQRPSAAPWPALKAEQAAYQALLSCGREHVVRQNQRQVARSSSRSQQQPADAAA
jgi:uncharacterized protein with PIN domain